MAGRSEPPQGAVEQILGRVLGEMACFGVVVDGRFAHVTEPLRRLVGMVSSDLELSEIVHPEERLLVREQGRQVLSSGEPRPSQRRRLVDRDGRALSVWESMAKIDWNGHRALGVLFFVPATQDWAEREPASQRDAFMARTRALARLSPRQREVAVLLAQGFTPTNVAARLGLSVETTRTHVKAIYKRIGISSRIELARLALGVEIPAPRRTPREGS